MECHNQKEKKDRVMEFRNLKGEKKQDRVMEFHNQKGNKNKIELWNSIT